MSSAVIFGVAKRGIMISGSTSSNLKESRRKLGIETPTRGPLPVSWMVKWHFSNDCACRRTLARPEEILQVNGTLANVTHAKANLNTTPSVSPDRSPVTIDRVNRCSVFYS
jgi:hypothetical protein